MTTVANQNVGPDSLGAATVKKGSKKGGNHAGFLGAGNAPTGGKFAQVSAGTPGPANGSAGIGLPLESAANLTKIDKALK